MDILKAKRETRKLLQLRREAETGRDTRSAAIASFVRAQDWYTSASSVCCYVSIGSEVDTRGLIDKALAENRRVIVPWCDENQLRLSMIRSRNELAPRTIGLLEPVDEVRRDTRRDVSPEDVDLFLVPGLGFSVTGDRIGYGKGYYDRLLGRDLSGIRCGLAFQCQILDELPTDSSDVRMDLIVSETGLVYSRFPA